MTAKLYIRAEDLKDLQDGNPVECCWERLWGFRIEVRCQLDEIQIIEHESSVLEEFFNSIDDESVYIRLQVKE